jgi:hypothetical protein
MQTPNCSEVDQFHDFGLGRLDSGTPAMSLMDRRRGRQALGSEGPQSGGIIGDSVAGGVFEAGRSA